MLARLNSFATPTGIRCYCIVLIEEKGMDKRIPKAAEHKRLEKSCDRKSHWKRWGPYVAERAWGTVREDYSANGDAWTFVSHDSARSKAYRWNEEGIAGICDRHQRICFALALWNEKDPILKERLFGLAGSQGFGDGFQVECPTGSGQYLTLWEVAGEISRRLSGIFLSDDEGRRPVFGNYRKFQQDDNWRDLIPFHEYFNGDTGAGIGASHQTGWTALVAKLLQQSGERTCNLQKP